MPLDRRVRRPRDGGQIAPRTVLEQRVRLPVGHDVVGRLVARSDDLAVEHRRAQRREPQRDERVRHGGRAPRIGERAKYGRRVSGILGGIFGGEGVDTVHLARLKCWHLVVSCLLDICRGVL